MSERKTVLRPQSASPYFGDRARPTSSRPKIRPSSSRPPSHAVNSLVDAEAQERRIRPSSSRPPSSRSIASSYIETPGTGGWLVARPQSALSTTRSSLGDTFSNFDVDDDDWVLPPTDAPVTGKVSYKQLYLRLKRAYDRLEIDSTNAIQSKDQTIMELEGQLAILKKQLDSVGKRKPSVKKPSDTSRSQPTQEAKPTVSRFKSFVMEELPELRKKQDSEEASGRGYLATEEACTQKRGFWKPLFRNIRNLWRMSQFENRWDIFDRVFSKRVQEIDVIFQGLLDMKVSEEEFVKRMDSMTSTVNIRQTWFFEIALQLRTIGQIVRFYDALNQIALVGLDREELCKALSRGLCETINCEGVRIFMVVGAYLHLVMDYTLHSGNEMRSSQVTRFVISDGLAGDVACSGNAVHLSRAFDDPRYSPPLDQQGESGTKPMIVIPVKDTQGNVIAVVSMLNNRVKSSFGEIDKLYANGFCEQFAMLSSHVHYYSKSWSFQSACLFFLKNTPSVSNRRALLLLLDNLVGRSQDFVKVQQHSVFLVDGKEVVSLSPVGDEVLQPPPLVVRQAINSGHPIFVSDASACTDLGLAKHVKTLLALPVLASQGEIVGVLQFVNKQSGVFVQSDLCVYQAVCNVSGAIIEQCGLLRGAFSTSDRVSTVLKTLKDLIKAEALQLFIVDNKDKKFYPADAPKHSFPLGTGIAGTVAQTGMPQHLGGESPAYDDLRYNIKVDCLSTRHCMCLISLPVRNKNRDDEILAVVQCSNKAEQTHPECYSNAELLIFKLAVSQLEEIMTER